MTTETTGTTVRELFIATDYTPPQFGKQQTEQNSVPLTPEIYAWAFIAMLFSLGSLAVFMGQERVKGSRRRSRRRR